MFCFIDIEVLGRFMDFISKMVMLGNLGVDFLLLGFETLTFSPMHLAENSQV